MATLDRYRMTISGTLDGPQTWSTGVSFTADGAAPVTPADLQTFLNSAEPMWATWWNSTIKLANGNDLTANKLTLTHLTAGSDKAIAVAEVDIAPALIGPALATTLPTYCALVVSTLTGHPGRSGRGRMYLPLTASTLQNHQAQDAVALGYATGTAALLSDLNTIDPGIMIVAVCGINGNFPITGVRCDSLPDVQHRREDKVGALFVESAPV